MTRADVANCLTDIRGHPDADVRRGAIHRIAHTRFHDDKDVMDTLRHGVLTDESESVRRAALRALCVNEPAQHVNILLKLLDRDEDTALLRPAGDQLRWDAVCALRDAGVCVIGDDGRGSEADVDSDIVDTAARLLATDPSRDVRLAAARLLELCPSRDALNALIRGLTQQDFGVVYACEKSLTRLTGQSHEHNPDRWRQWLATVSDPFAGRRRPEQARGRPWWRPW